MTRYETSVVLSLEEDGALDFIFDLNSMPGVVALLPESDSTFEEENHPLYSLDINTLIDVTVRLLAVPASIVTLASAIVNYRAARQKDAAANNKETIKIGETSQPLAMFVDSQALADYIDGKINEAVKHKLEVMDGEENKSQKTE